MSKHSPSYTTFISLLPADEKKGKAITGIYHTTTMTNFSLSFFSAFEISVPVLHVLCNSDRFEDSGYKLRQESLLHVI